MDAVKKVTWKKKIKVPNKNHITDDLDSNAPLSQILDELPHKNKEAFKFYGRNLRQRCSLMKHSLLPNYPLNSFKEEWDGQLLSNYFDPLRYKSLLPQIITPIRHQGKTDPIIDGMRKKLEWNKKLRNYAYTASNHKYEQRFETLNNDVISCPKAIVSIAHLLDNDPEPYFNATYNWYYAGFGSLHLITLSNKQYLLYSEFATLYLKTFNKTEVKIISHDPVASYDCGQEYNIFEIVYSVESIPIVALRTKNKIFILKINISDDLIEFEKITSLDAEKPFVGISFDTFHKKVLYVTLIDWNFYLINVETLLAKKILLKGNSSKLLNNWNIILSTKRSYYTNVAGNAIHVYDKRTNALEHVYNNIKSIVDETYCNPITVARQFEDSNYLYFGTNHHLFVLDLRFVKQYKLQATQRWTHGMEFPPVYLNRCNFESNKDLLCLSSQWCEDMCVISDYKKGDFITSENGITIPYRPPSILSVLQEAQSHLSCNNTNLIDSRLSTTISGTTLIEQTKSFDILMLNSLGDITHHALYPEHMNDIVEDSIPQLYEWAKSYNPDRKMFEVTAIINIAKVWKQLVKVPEERELVTDIEDERFDINEIKEIFEKEEIDVELKEVWMDQMEDDLTINGSAFSFHL